MKYIIILPSFQLPNLIEKPVIWHNIHVSLQVHKILHPSPASSKANKGWAPQALEQLRDENILSVFPNGNKVLTAYGLQEQMME